LRAWQPGGYVDEAEQPRALGVRDEIAPHRDLTPAGSSWATTFAKGWPRRLRVQAGGRAATNVVVSTGKYLNMFADTTSPSLRSMSSSVSIQATITESRLTTSIVRAARYLFTSAKYRLLVSRSARTVIWWPVRMGRDALTIAQALGRT
jgi:hypothetical protein